MIRGLRIAGGGELQGLVPRDVQGNILRPYGFAASTHLFVHINDRREGVAALRDLVPNVTSGAPWRAKPTSTLNISFTYAGLVALGLASNVLDSFPDAFRQGMAARAVSLGDTGAAAPEKWEPGLGTGDAHVLFTVHTIGVDECTDAIETLRSCLDRHGLSVISEQRGERLADRKEHFGYADGFGQPAVKGIGDPTFGEGSEGSFHHWHGLPVGEIFHGHVDADGYPAPGPAAPFNRNGTYKVWRKLHEDVATFRSWVGEQAKTLDVDEQLLRAKLIGRWPDGSPLALTPDQPDPDLGLDPSRVNTFDYSDDPAGARCPLGAHIRRANPRCGLQSGDALTARQRIIRRGMTYGPALPDGQSDDGTDRGIFFVAYMADIERQYEFIQANWCNDGDAVHVGHDRDPFIGRAAGDHKFTIPGETPKFVHPIPELVTTRGGEYLWVPSMEALRHLAGVAPGAVSRVSMRERASERVLGTALGVALAPLAAALGFVRGKRVVHPVGAAFHAEVVVDGASVSLVEGTVLGQPGRYPAIARLSRGFAIPLRWPDVHGLAVRILDADGSGRPQDFLVATAKRKQSGPRRDRGHQSVRASVLDDAPFPAARREMSSFTRGQCSRCLATRRCTPASRVVGNSSSRPGRRTERCARSRGSCSARRCRGKTRKHCDSTRPTTPAGSRGRECSTPARRIVYPRARWVGRRGVQAGKG